MPSTSPRFNAANRVDSSGMLRITMRLMLGVLRQTLEGLKDQLDAGAERDEFVWSGADRRLLEAVVSDLLDVFLRHDPAGAGGAGVEGEEIGPRFLQLEPDMLRVGCLDRRHAVLHQCA